MPWIRSQAIRQHQHRERLAISRSRRNNARPTHFHERQKGFPMGICKIALNKIHRGR